MTLAAQAGVAYENAQRYKKSRSMPREWSAKCRNAPKRKGAARVGRKVRESLLLESVPEHALDSGRGSKFLEVNDSFLRLTGYTRDEVVDRTATEPRLLGGSAWRGRRQYRSFAATEYCVISRALFE